MTAPVTREDIHTEISVIEAYMSKLKTLENREEYLELTYQYYELIDKLENIDSNND